MLFRMIFTITFLFMVTGIFKNEHRNVAYRTLLPALRTLRPSYWRAIIYITAYHFKNKVHIKEILMGLL